MINAKIRRNSGFGVKCRSHVCGLSGSVFMDGADGILSFHHENRPWEIRHTGGRAKGRESCSSPPRGTKK